MGSHQSAKMKNDEWLTPIEIIKSLGDFDLDPCSPINRPWDTAKYHFDMIHDGLNQKWFGRVWLNPPYGKQTKKWMKKMCDHKNGIALIFARTETALFFDYVWNEADAILFIEGRIHFHFVNGDRANANSGAPSVLIAYGKSNVSALKESGIKGKLIEL